MGNSKNLSESTPPRKMDRLAAFLGSFKLTALVLDPKLPVKGPSLWLHELLQGGGRIALRMTSHSQPPADIRAVVAIDFENAANPLMKAIPEEISVALDDVPALSATTQAFLSEVESNRCGRLAALDRLAEVMVLMVLRQLIDEGGHQAGLFAALAHPNLHRALVSMHDHPEKAWNVEQLAEVAAMSRTQFMTKFRRIMGTSPMNYLGTWRLALASRQLKEGHSVKSVARRVGFNSAEGFSRAYSRVYGKSPKARRD